MSNKNTTQIDGTTNTDKTFYFSGYNVSLKAKDLAEAHLKLAEVLKLRTETTQPIETILETKTN